MWSRSAPPPADNTFPDDVHQAGEGEEEPAISVPDSGDTGEGGKLKMIVQLVKKSLGVKDIAAMRLSLPASLLEPIPNLEYWHYLDRPDFFAAINDSNDPFERMLAVLRFTFTKDIKFVHGKVVKPYNSVLGEHFRAHWDVLPLLYADNASPQSPAIIPQLCTRQALPEGASTVALLTEETASIKSAKSSKSARSGLSLRSKQGSSIQSTSTKATSIEPNADAQMSSLSLADRSQDSSGESDGDVDGVGDGKRMRIVYMTEQVSHHPPVSAFYASCPDRKIEMTGIDQISAKVSGTTLRVSPGSFNKGLYIQLTGGAGEGEGYHITHPVASVNGILRGSFYITVGDSTIVTCTGGKGPEQLRAVIEYKEESWIGKSQFLLEGAIHTYDPSETAHDDWTKVKHVPADRILATFEGSWRSRIKWKRVRDYSPSSKTSGVASGAQPDSSSPKTSAEECLIDLSTLSAIPKRVRPLSRQLPTESRKLWEKVTEKLLKKEFGDATKEKVVIEQKQRDEAAERKRMGAEFVAKYFEQDWKSGNPKLTNEGRKVVEEELAETNEPSAKAEGLKPPAA